MRAHDSPDKAASGTDARRPRTARADHLDSPQRTPGSAEELLALQRTVGNAAVARMMEPEQESEPVQRSSVHDVLSSPGRPMDGPLRQEMEARLGADFSGVRVHDDSAARRSAAEIGARAYTSDNHVVIGTGGADKHTWAHELTHVVQQSSGPVAGTETGDGLKVSDPADRFEREAERVATQAMSAPPHAPPTGQSEPQDHTHDHVNAMPAEPTAVQRATPVQRAPSSQGQKRKHSDTDGQQRKIHHFFPPGSGQQSGTEDLDEVKRIATLSPEVRQQEFLDKLRAAFINGGWQIGRSSKGEEYAHKDQGLSRTHDYQNEPEVEGLRWISTVTKRYLINKGYNPQEVQAAIGNNGKLVIAANADKANKHLADESIRKGDLIGWMLNTDKLTPEQAKKEHENDTQARTQARVGRESRHFAGLENVHKEKGPDVPTRYGALLSAIKLGVVIAQEGADGMHAERRIRKFNGNTTPPYLAGTKRPCATCFSELYPEGSPKDEETGKDTVRPGKFIFNERSNIGIREYQDSEVTTPARRASSLFERVNEAITQTYESTARNNATVYGIGSDSE